MLLVGKALCVPIVANTDQVFTYTRLLTLEYALQHAQGCLENRKQLRIPEPDSCLPMLDNILGSWEIHLCYNSCQKTDSQNTVANSLLPK